MSFQEIWQFVLDKPAVATFILGLAGAVIGGGWAIYHRLIPARGKGEVQSIDVASIVKTLQEGHRQQIEDAIQREEALRDQVRQLTDAVQALSDERNEPDAPPGIDEALAFLAKGETDAAESVFQEVKERLKADEPQEAAATARHIGALAFLHDTDKALSAYREAVELDPENSDGWNQLGHLLKRIGDLEGAEGAYGHVLSLGNQTDDKELIAVATGNLGIVYQIRGDLDRAEEMYEKSLALNEELGRKEGMANQYGNLGLVYQTRGNLDRAEEMYRKSLALHEEFGRKEGMATDYGNLGNLYLIRGDLDRAEEMLKKSLAIEEELGRKEGMASDYGNLGVLYKTRGDLDRAEEMYGKSLEIEKALGRKDGMASDYGNLGNVFRIRGDLDRAEEMYEKSLELFQQVGATPQIEQTERLLAELREPKE